MYYEMSEAIVSVTKKGQATIPSKLRKKHGIGRKVLVVDTDAGVLLEARPRPSSREGVFEQGV